METRTKRVRSILSGNHQLLGTAQKRVSVPNGAHRASGSHHSIGSEERVLHLHEHFQGRP